MGVFDDYATRLERCGSRIRELHDLHKQEIARRDHLIREALQVGMSQRKIAVLIGRSRGRIYQVQGTSAEN